MANENDSDSMEPKRMWRPAAMFDIGSIARFADFEYGGFSYGILKRIGVGVACTPDGDEIEAMSYYCDLSDRSEMFKYDEEPFVFCWIQYDGNEMP